MGGHGGLNILPQKRWNVYRYDNREKVSNDESNYKKQCEEALKKNHQEKLHSKIVYLTQRNANHQTNSHTEATQSIEALHEDIRERKSQRFNLFAEEEHMYSEAVKRHETYLKKVSMPDNKESHFDRIARDTNLPWYMRSRNQIFQPLAAPSTLTPLLPNASFHYSTPSENTTLFKLKKKKHETVDQSRKHSKSNKQVKSSKHTLSRNHTKSSKDTKSRRRDYTSPPLSVRLV